MKTVTVKTQRLLDLLGHDEAPFGLHYSDVKPEGHGPKPGEPISREREDAGAIDWQKVFGNFSCVMGNLWIARKKKKAAWLSQGEYGCMGGGYYCGMYRPYLETVAQYVSTGIVGTPHDGERYLPSPESMRTFLEKSLPPLPRGKYCVFKPLDQFTDEDPPLVVIFFARPEVITGLHSLTGYTTGDCNAVVSPFGAGCTAIAAWPLVYQQQGKECAVLGGFDVSARKYMKPDELSFAIPLPLYRNMLDAMEESALPRRTWEGVRKKVQKSGRAWGENET